MMPKFRDYRYANGNNPPTAVRLRMSRTHKSVEMSNQNKDRPLFNKGVFDLRLASP
jgi:hypothetical protein